MNAFELYKLVLQGEKPVIKFNDNVYEWIEESVDASMIAKIIGASIEHGDTIRFEIDLSEFETHNRSVAQNNWIDEEGNATLTWFETVHYPESGVESFYLPIDENTEVAFDFVEEESLLNEYIKNHQGMSYVKWLENEVTKLRTS